MRCCSRRTRHASCTPCRPGRRRKRDHVERVVGHPATRSSTRRGRREDDAARPYDGHRGDQHGAHLLPVTRVLGVAADAERLYVVLWSSGRIFDRPPAEDAALEGGRYELRVFWLGDGSALCGAAVRTRQACRPRRQETSLGCGTAEARVGWRVLLRDDGPVRRPYAAGRVIRRREGGGDPSRFGARRARRRVTPPRSGTFETKRDAQGARHETDRDRSGPTGPGRMGTTRLASGGGGAEGGGRSHGPADQGALVPAHQDPGRARRQGAAGVRGHGARRARRTS